MGTGPGQSVERVFSIWNARVTDIRRPVTLGGISAANVDVNMYGIAAVALT